jgi:hypothetical protein
MAKKPMKSKGIGGWLGRQIGHVKKAVQTPVPAKKIYRRSTVVEKPVPGKPNVTLRRKVTDELIVREDEGK